MDKLCVDSADRIRLRFTIKEIRALLYLLSLPCIPQTDWTPAAFDDETLSSLQAGEWVTVQPDRIMVNQLAAMIMTNMAHGDATISAQCGAVRMLLIRCKQMCVLVESRGGAWVTIEPLESAASAGEALLSVLEIMPDGWTLSLNGDTTIAGTPERARDYCSTLEDEHNAIDHR